MSLSLSYTYTYTHARACHKQLCSGSVKPSKLDLNLSLLEPSSVYLPYLVTVTSRQSIFRLLLVSNIKERENIQYLTRNGYNWVSAQMGESDYNMQPENAGSFIHYSRLAKNLKPPGLLAFHQTISPHWCQRCDIGCK